MCLSTRGLPAFDWTRKPCYQAERFQRSSIFHKRPRPPFSANAGRCKIRLEAGCGNAAQQRRIQACLRRLQSAHKGKKRRESKDGRHDAQLHAIRRHYGQVTLPPAAEGTHGSHLLADCCSVSPFATKKSICDRCYGWRKGAHT